MRNVHFRFLSAAQKRRLHKLSNIKGNNNKQKDSSGTIRMIMVMTKNNYDNDDDDYLQLNKMYEGHENKIALLISPANFPRKKNYTLRNILRDRQVSSKSFYFNIVTILKTRNATDLESPEIAFLTFPSKFPSINLPDK